MKKRYRLKKWVKFILTLLIIFSLILVVFNAINKPRQAKNSQLKENIKKEEKTARKQKNGVLEHSEDFKEIVEEEQQREIYEKLSNTYTVRMTSYYPEEGETMTASGLGIDNFGVNENGWFTYNGKVVIATASTRLGHTEMKTYNLYDELILNIDGIDYEAIVLDVCGACMWDNRIDLFASSVIYAKDTTINVRGK